MIEKKPKRDWRVIVVPVSLVAIVVLLMLIVALPLLHAYRAESSDDVDPLVALVRTALQVREFNTVKN